MSAARWHPENPCGSKLNPRNITISDSGGLDLEAWCLDVWMLEGLEWIGGGDGGDGGIGMDARWEEVIGRNSHTLELQELGGLGPAGVMQRTGARPNNSNITRVK